MSKHKKRLGAITLVFLVAGALITFVASGSAATAPPVEATFPTFTPASGPQLTASAVADDAVKFARESGEAGGLTLRIAHGNLLRAHTVIEDEPISVAITRENSLQPAASAGNAFCTPGPEANCSVAEQAHAKQVLLEEGRSGTYVVLLTGKKFAPLEHLRRGTTEITGSWMALALNDRTGVRESMVIGGTGAPPKVEELGAVATFWAAPESVTAQAAHSVQRPRNGSIEGTLNTKGEVVAFHDKEVAARATVKHGRFRIPILLEGMYKIAGRLRSGRYCHGRSISVRVLHVTHVALSCPRG